MKSPKSIKSQILHEYSDIISKYKDIKYVPKPQEGNYPIWVMWWQGENNMPEIVKICYASILKHSGQHQVNLITQDSYEEYLSDLPYLNDLLQLINNGSLSFTSFSDICRHYLIYSHGGLWCDATILLTDDVDNFITNRIFVSCMVKNVSKPPSYMDCSSFFFYASKHNPMFRFVYEVLTRHAINHGSFICYFMVNHCVHIAYKLFDYAHYTIHQSPIFPNMVHYFIRIMSNHNILNNAYDETRFRSVTKSIPFQKLSYKWSHYDEFTNVGELTYYGYLKNKYLK